MPASADSAPFRVAALPFDVRPGEVEHNAAVARAGLEEAADAGARLLLLPEKWTTSFLPSYPDDLLARSAAAVAELHAAARDLGVHVLGSVADPEPGRDRPLNRVVVLGGERVLRPWAKRVLFSPTGEGRQVARGDGAPRAFHLDGVGRVLALVCYELRFPELTREAFLQDCALLCVPAQWPTPRAAAWELLLRARACEDQVFVLGCNRAGRAELEPGRPLEFPGSAALCDPFGDEVARTDDGLLLVAELDPARRTAAQRALPLRRDLERAGLAPGRSASLGERLGDE